MGSLFMPLPSLDIHEMFNLEDKVALVTDGSRGIGYMMAQGLLQAGAKVYITARTVKLRYEWFRCHRRDKERRW
jgi:NAD(P)-dependent dehydrogenase (short-subunit alcohol dehydrogenase family)